MVSQAQLEGAQNIIRRMMQEAASMRARITELEAELAQLRDKRLTPQGRPVVVSAFGLVWK